MKNIYNMSLTDVSNKARPDPLISSESYGRSMVEMLGVLAIIAVLSAGALAGYSKAMFRHKMNQTIDEATKIFQRFEEIKEKDWGATDEELFWVDNPENAIKFGLLDKCNNPAPVPGTMNGCQLPIGYVAFDLAQEKNNSADCGNGTWGQINFAFTDSKSCDAFLSTHWEQILPVDWWTNNSTIRIWAKQNSTDLYSKNSPALTIEQISQSCSKCDDEGYCLIIFTYRAYC